LEYYLEIPSKISYINDVRFFLENATSDLGLDRIRINKVFLGLEEVVLNSIVHGNKMVISKVVRLKFYISKQEISVIVSDEGNGFSIDSVPNPLTSGNIKNEHGRGILLVRNLADEVLYLDGGRKVSLTFKL